MKAYLYVNVREIVARDLVGRLYFEDTCDPIHPAPRATELMDVICQLAPAKTRFVFPDLDLHVAHEGWAPSEQLERASDGRGRRYHFEHSRLAARCDPGAAGEDRCRCRNVA